MEQMVDQYLSEMKDQYECNQEGSEYNDRNGKQHNRDRERRRGRDMDRPPRRRDRSREYDRDQDWNTQRDYNRDRYNKHDAEEGEVVGDYEDTGDYAYREQGRDMWRERDRSYDRNREHDRGGRGMRGGGDDRGRDRGGEKWMTEVPTHTILLRGLPPHIDEPDIRSELLLFGTLVKDVRLVKRKDTGASRGFAFVEFQNVNDAQRWMDHNQGKLNMQDHIISMHFSSPKDRQTDGRPGIMNDWVKADWICSKCGVHNFKRRDFCFKCNISRDESERKKDGDGFDHVGNNPCNTLIFRGLDALTTEDNISAALRQFTALVVKNIKVVRDEVTGVSRGFGFSEMQSIQHSTDVLEMISATGQPFEVDGKAIIVAYAKNTYNTTMATMNQQHQASSYYPGQASSQQGYYADNGQYYDPTTGQYYDYAAYYALQQTAGGESNTQSDKANAAAAVAQAAIAQTQAAKKQTDAIVAKVHNSTTGSVWSAGQTTITDQHSSEYNATAHKQYIYPTADGKYPIPDVSTYQYDETSGYYYDPVTSLYYDANSQYYFHSADNQFLFWDGHRQTYLPAPPSTDQLGAANNTGGATAVSQMIPGQEPYADEYLPETKVKKEKDKKEKIKVAKKIAKDMEKWAKSMNARKDAMRDFKLGGMGMPQESASADAGFTVMEKKSVMDRTPGPELGEENKLMPPPPAFNKPTVPQKAATSDGLVAQYGGDSDEEEEPSSEEIAASLQSLESSMLDWSKFACLLCRRQFPNREALQRHQQLSDLHKQKLDELKKAKGLDAAGQVQYRDRAKERRSKYGTPGAPPAAARNKSRNGGAPIKAEQPTLHGLKSDNRGSMLMQKMGWSEGQGLGRSNQGIVNPVQAKVRNAAAGLGATGSNYNVVPGDSYKDTVKKVMYARFHESE